MNNDLLSYCCAVDTVSTGRVNVRTTLVKTLFFSDRSARVIQNINLLYYFLSQLIYTCKRFSCHGREIFLSGPKMYKSFRGLSAEFRRRVTFPSLSRWVWLILVCIQFRSCDNSFGMATIVLFVHTPEQSVARDRQHNCNLPNESSGGPN